MQYLIRAEHVTFDAAGVRWRDWPWQEDRVRSWQDVTDVRIVRIHVAPSGRERERPHLGLEFRDGTVLHAGGKFDLPPGHWEAPAALASQKSGVPVRRVDRD
jgi:hypothetical protein